MNAGYARPMYLNPLLSKSRVVNVSYIQMNPDGRLIHIIQKGPEFSRRKQEALFRITIFAADFNARLGCQRRELLHRIYCALVYLVVGRLFSHQSRNDKDRIATE